MLDKQQGQCIIIMKIDLRFKGYLMEGVTTLNATFSLFGNSFSLGLGFLECKDKGWESWCTIYRHGEWIRLDEITNKWKCFSDVIEHSEYTLNVRENNILNVLVGCRTFVKERAARSFLRNIERLGRAIIEHSKKASNVRLR
jgi:hypothetical protein